MKVTVNAGHAPMGVPDPGAINLITGDRECDYALKVANLVQRYLNDAGLIAQVIQNDSLGYICDVSNDFGSDAFVSIHCNAFDTHARGTEVWYKTERGSTLANCIQKQLLTSIQTVDRGIKQTDTLWVLNQTEAVAALVEVGFIDNMDDLKMMQSNMDAIARAIARGITDYQGVM